MRLMTVGIVASAIGSGRDVAAVAHDGHPIGDLLELLEPMRDVDDPDAVISKLADDPEQFLDLGIGQGGSRLVHDEDRGVERERLGDLDHLLPGDCQGADLDPRIDVEVEQLEHPPGAGVQLLLVESEGQSPARLAADEDVLRHRQVGHQVQLLVDDADAQLLRRFRARDDDLVALETNGPGVGLVDPAEHLHEGRLAGSVLADQRVDLARVQLERRLVERVDTRKVLGDALHLDEGLASPKTLRPARAIRAPQVPAPSTMNSFLLSITESGR